MRIELTREGLLVNLANPYTNRGAQLDAISIEGTKRTILKKIVELSNQQFLGWYIYIHKDY